MIRLVVFGALVAAAQGVAGQAPGLNPSAVNEVLAGKRRVANAAWWGFDPANSTAALQAAIRSSARKVIVPNLGRDWVVDPIKLVSDLELVFKRGVVVIARKGGFPGLGDSLFTADKQHNIVLRGYGATLAMQKPEYTKGEWRMCLDLESCTHVKVLGLTLKDSGGDGIYLGNSDPKQPYCKDIVVRDCVLENNRRQGMSVITAVDLLVDRCTFRNTNGTAPQAGVDLEPNRAEEKLVNCLFRDCIMDGNRGPGILVYLGAMDETAEPISIRFERCRLTGANGSGIDVAGTRAAGPKGNIEFGACTIDGCQGPGLTIASKFRDAASVRFDRCTWRNVARRSPNPPVSFTVWNGASAAELGGVEFDRCTVEDDRDRPWLSVNSAASGGVAEVRGTVTVRNPHGARWSLGEGRRSVSIRVREVR